MWLFHAGWRRVACASGKLADLIDPGHFLEADTFPLGTDKRRTWLLRLLLDIRYKVFHLFHLFHLFPLFPSICLLPSPTSPILPTARRTCHWSPRRLHIALPPTCVPRRCSHWDALPPYTHKTMLRAQTPAPRSRPSSPSSPYATALSPSRICTR